MEDRLAAQLADAGFQSCTLGLLHARGPALLRGDLGHAAALDAIGVIHERYGLQQARARVVGYVGEYGAIGGDRFEQFGRVAESFDQQASVNVRRDSHCLPA